MASSNTVTSTLTSRDYHCKVCNLYLDSVESLEVHLQYHKENLYVKWGTQNVPNDSENNNSPKVRNETTVSAPADSSDNMITKPSPEFQQRATPETSGQFQHPATPQSYHSAPSPYQNADQTTFSPGTQFGNNFQHANFPQNSHSEQITWEPTPYNQDYKSNRFHPYNMQERVSQVSSSSPIYGQPLNQPTPSPSPNQCDKCGFVCDSVVQLNEHCNSAHAGTSGVPNNVSMGFQQFAPKQYNSTGTYQTEKIKEEHEESSDILDLDSHKVVYQGNEGEAQNSTYEETTSQVREPNTRTVPMMPWETKLYNNPQVNGDVSLFKDQKMFAEQKSFPSEPKMFHGDQKFAYAQDKFLPVHGDQKPYLHVDQKLYSGVQMPPLSDYPGAVVSNNADLKPPYRPYDSPNTPQITSTQPPNPSALPSIGSKGANWKSNEARRPKTYNCTACNKWFTSSGHLKRHYNTTLHKNAVRSSGQPDPATMPISTHHHPSRDSLQNRAQQQNNENNTQSPVPVEDSRSVDDGGLQSSYSAQNFERTHRVGNLQNKSQYTHLSQGNIENNFSNNPLANHSLQHQIGSHPINIGTQPPGIGMQNDSSHHGSKSITIGSNPPNGEAGPSVTPNHHMRDLLSVSTSNIITPVLTQNTPALTAHPLPPFSHLGVNPYNPRSTDPLGPTVPNPTPQLFINQNFQQSIAPNYPNGIAPHVTDMVINNQRIVSPATSGEPSVQVVHILKQETASPEPDGGRLPSFSQFHTQRYDVNGVIKPNVGGQYIADESLGNFIFSNSFNTLQNSVDVETQNVCYDFNIISKSVKDNVFAYNLDNVKNYQLAYAVGGKNIIRDDAALKKNVIQILKIEKFDNVVDYANKENFGVQMTSPNRPESATSEDNNGVSSNGIVGVGAPLTERNVKKSQPNVIHKCYECDKLFNKACYLTQHNKTFHSGAKPFKCDRCGKRFPDGTSFETHYLKHAHDKPFKCPECPKSFNHKTDLRRHMCLHSGSKPFTCEHCGKGFIRQDHMIKHFDTHKKKIMRSSMSSSPSSSLT